MTPQMPVSWQRVAAEAVLEELGGRSGIGNALDDIDDDIREEIVEALAEAISLAHEQGGRK